MKTKRTALVTAAILLLVNLAIAQWGGGGTATTQRLLSDVMRDLVMWAGFLLALAGVVSAVVDVSTGKKYAIEYMVAFVVAGLAANLKRIANATYNRDPHSAEIIMVIGAFIALVALLLYIQMRNMESKVARDVGGAGGNVNAAPPVDTGWRPANNAATRETEEPEEDYIPTDKAPRAKLIWQRDEDKPKVFRITKTYTLIGRGGNCDVRIQDSKVSHEHASISDKGDDFFLRDKGSANGTFIRASDGEKVRVENEERLLDDGDVIILGEAHLTFRKMNS